MVETQSKTFFGYDTVSFMIRCKWNVVAEKGINETLPDRLVCLPPGLLRGTAGVYYFNYYNYYYNYYSYNYYYYSWCLGVLSGKVVTGARLLLLILLALLLSISSTTTIPPLLLPILRNGIATWSQGLDCLLHFSCSSDNHCYYYLYFERELGGQF